MKIAIASSGLAHVTRGIETWAYDTAQALREAGLDATLFCNTTPPNPPQPCIPLHSLQRQSPLARILARLCPPPLWRFGFTSPYGLEQARFWHALRPHLRDGSFDILHVQDPMLAWWCRRARHTGTLATREILAHGTEEPPAFLAPFEFVQHLAPWHLEQTTAALGTAPPGWCAMPNFVRTDRFQPDPDARRRMRTELGIPPDAHVVGCAAALKRDHKRIDYLIDEVAACGPTLHGAPLHLLLCGASHPDTPALRAEASSRLGPRFHCLPDLPHARMPAILATMDRFVLASRFEMMPIAVLEALATALPLLLNDHPVLRWMGGADAPPELRGADCIDMSLPGALTQALHALPPAQLATRAAGARRRAETMFSTQAVIPQYLACYQHIATGVLADIKTFAEVNIQDDNRS